MIKLQVQLLLVLMCIHTVHAQTDDSSCPAADAACRCYDESIVCVDLSQRAVIPPFNSSSTVFSMLSFQGDTRVLDVQSQAFAGLRVIILDLSELGLTVVDQDAFSGLNVSVLTKLILANNSLQVLPTTVFAGLMSLAFLDLRNNYVVQLQSNMFSDLRTSLTALLISDNRITTGGLQSGVLSRFDQLTRLEIEDNLLTRWPSEMLAGSTTIAELSLAGNRITTFPKGSFDGLQQLVKLHLGRNDIAALETGTFRNLTSLRELDLSGNRLRNLNGNMLEGLDSLMKLDLSVNQLSELSLSTLSVSYTHLTLPTIYSV